MIIMCLQRFDSQKREFFIRQAEILFSISSRNQLLRPYKLLQMRLSSGTIGADSGFNFSEYLFCVQDDIGGHNAV